ncbi:MAG TPA: vitamin K epoxide reductase family protein [Candidatus Dormibacteraeota bacterium]|nr:vitamin K epoxide reductase family protein [Candidatus Dormibacteraeota bacterium]
MGSHGNRGWQRAALLVISIAGTLIAVYLTVTHFSFVPLVCTVSSVVNCASVTHSAYSVIPGTSIPISVLGVLWFVGLGGFALTSQRWLQLLWAAIGLAVVLYLVFVEIVLLHQICEWCTVVHGLVVATFVVTVRRLQTGE